MLAEARTLPEIKEVRDKAQAVRKYAKAAHLGRESQNYAAEIALLASRKAGEILGQLQKTPKQSAATVAGDSEYRAALKDTDTPEKTAQNWQRLAAIPEAAVTTYLENCKLTRDEISAAGLLRVVKLHDHAPQPHRPELSDIREQLRLAYPLVDIHIRKSSFKNMSQRGCFDLELRTLTRDEMELACATVRAARQKKGRAAA